MTHLQNDSPTAKANQAPRPQSSAWQRLAGLVGWLLGSTLVLAGALVLGGWWWSGSPQSLARVLHWTTQTLPLDAQGQRPLHVEGVTGSLRQGGRIERLRWQQDGLQVEVQGLALAWPEHLWWDLLWHRQLTQGILNAERVRILDERPDTPPQPLQAPQHLALPWLHQVSLRAEWQHLQWDGRTPLQVGPMQLRYAYGPGAAGHAEHQATLQADLLTYGRYQAEARLGAQGPLALALQLSGQLQAPLPSGRAPLDLTTTLQVQGNLLGAPGETAELQVQAHVAPAQVRAGNAAPQLDAALTLRPWAALPLHQGELRFQQLDLAILWPGAPHTGLSGAWRAGPLGPLPAASTPLAQAMVSSDWQLQGHLRNDRPAPWDQGGLPVAQLQADLRWQAQTWTLHALEAQLAGGALEANGQLPWTDGQPGAWQGQLRLRGVQPRQLLSSLPLPALDAELHASALGHGPTLANHFRVRLGPAAGPADPALLPAVRLQAEGDWQPDRWRLTQGQLQVLGAQATASGSWVPSRQQWDGQLQAQAPGLALQINGQWGPTATARTSQAELTLNSLEALQGWLQTSLRQLQAPLHAVPSQWLSALQTSRWMGQAGLQAQWVGRGPWQLSAQARGVSLQGNRSDQPWTWQIPQLALRVDGPGMDQPAATVQTLALTVSSPQYPMGVKADLVQATTLARTEPGLWRLGAGRLQLQPISSQPRIPPAMAHLSTQGPAVLAWNTSLWQQGRLRSTGRLDGLALSWLNAWLADASSPEGPLRRAGLQGDLGLTGEWDLDLPLQPQPSAADPARAKLSLAHRQGDLTLLTGTGPSAEPLPVGLREARLALALEGERLSAQLRWRSDRAGMADAEGSTTLQAPQGNLDWTWADGAALRGQLQADLPQIGLWSRLAPPGWRVSGRLQARAALAGTRAQPVWDGELQASELTLRSLLDGLDFSDGRLSARLSGETLTITQLQLRGAGGEAGGLLTGQGQATWARPEGQPGAARQASIDLQLQARQLRLLARADRRLTLSGQAQARLRGQQLTLEGQLSADQALWLLPDESTPTLGSDVVVRGTERPPGFGAGAGVVPQVRVSIDLGRDFRVRGLGIDTYLEGRLQLVASPAQPTPQLTGQVRTQRGSYRAYGQALRIEQGRIRFNGPLDNPSLDILALRPLPTQRVGVAITGTAQAPRVRLYAEPDLPDSEKLAWLVLGRPASGAGAEAAVLQQAALALLSGRGSAQDGSVTRALGLDELSFQGESTQADGSTSAAAITLGKRISSQLYVSYNRSLVGAMGTVAVFYDVSRWLTLRAQAGDDNAVDLIFSHRFDGQSVPPRPNSR